MSRQLNIRLGRDGPVQRFSLARTEERLLAEDILATLRASTNTRLRDQTLSDPTKCSQFACRWGDRVGFLTRPVIVERPPTPPLFWVVSLTKSALLCLLWSRWRISMAPSPLWFPVATPTCSTSRPTPKVPTPFADPPPPAPIPDDDDATVGELPDAPEPIPGTLGCLHFPLPDPPTPADHPVVIALPTFLPLAPGQSFPLDVDLTQLETYGDAFPLFKTWCAGLRYVMQHNRGISVTLDGPLFHIPDLILESGDDPFHGLTVLLQLPGSLFPLQHLPTNKSLIA